MQHHTQNGRAATGCTFLPTDRYAEKNGSCRQSRDINQAWLDKGFWNLKGDGAGRCQRKRTATRWLCLAQKKPLSILSNKQEQIGQLNLIIFFCLPRIGDEMFVASRELYLTQVFPIAIRVDFGL